MLWFNSHRRFQEQLSAYIDAELPEEDALALDAHLQSCDACSRELEELRLASAVLGELPDVDAPRSFALTPDDVARPAPASPVRSINTSLRLTGAGLAAALAVLLVLDTGGLVGGGDEEGRDESAAFFSAAMQDRIDDKALEAPEAASDGDSASAGSADAYYFGTGSPVPGASAAAGDPLRELGAESGVGTGGGGVAGSGGELTGTPVAAGAGGPAPAEPTQAPADSSAPGAGGGSADESASPVAGELAMRSSAVATPTPTATPGTPFTVVPVVPNGLAAELGLNGSEEQDSETLSTSDISADSDDGPSALLVTEIVLTALLGASIVGVAAATYAERRRR